jgi:hypothetical protein
MTIKTGFKAPGNRLGPDDLRMAADAFEATLRVLDDSTCRYPANTARLLIGRYIIERALAGERDPAKLGEGALACLELLDSAGIASFRDRTSALH